LDNTEKPTGFNTILNITKNNVFRMENILNIKTKIILKTTG
jgi:hypothetical protein